MAKSPPPHDDSIPSAGVTQSFGHNPNAPTETVDLFNPCRGARVIHDGIDGSHKAIVIKPGETVKNVKLSQMVADELRARVKPRGKEKSDLHVLKPGSSPPSEAMAKPPAEDQDVDDGK